MTAPPQTFDLGGGRDQGTVNGTGEVVDFRKSIFSANKDDDDDASRLSRQLLAAVLPVCVHCSDLPTANIDDEIQVTCQCDQTLMPKLKTC